MLVDLLQEITKKAREDHGKPPVFDAVPMAEQEFESAVYVIGPALTQRALGGHYDYTYERWVYPPNTGKLTIMIQNWLQEKGLCVRTCLTHALTDGMDQLKIDVSWMECKCLACGREHNSLPIS